MKTAILILAFLSIYTSASASCFDMFSIRAFDSRVQYNSCITDCPYRYSPDRCLRGCQAQYGGALDYAGDLFDVCIAAQK